MARQLKQKRKAVILERDGYRCQYCGLTRADGAILEVDHKVPRARGGADRMSNLITSCRDCNRSKRDKPLVIPPLKRPDRHIINADGSVTLVWPKGVSAEQVAKELSGVQANCLSCGCEARNWVIWTSPYLVGRENKRRSFIYPICGDCATRLFTHGEREIGDKIDDILIAQAQAAKHVRLVESFDISVGDSK